MDPIFCQVIMKSVRRHSILIGTAIALTQLYHVSGKSMSPTINREGNDSLLLLDKISCWFGIYTPNVNDVVVFTKPGMENKSVVKRVAATSGQSVIKQDGTVVIVKPGKIFSQIIPTTQYF